MIQGKTGGKDESSPEQNKTEQLENVMEKYYGDMKGKYEIEKAFESSETDEETSEAIKELRPRNSLRVRKFMDVEKLRNRSKFDRPARLTVNYNTKIDEAKEEREEDRKIALKFRRKHLSQINAPEGRNLSQLSIQLDEYSSNQGSPIEFAK